MKTDPKSPLANIEKTIAGRQMRKRFKGSLYVYDLGEGMYMLQDTGQYITQEQLDDFRIFGGMEIVILNGDQNANETTQSVSS